MALLGYREVGGISRRGAAHIARNLFLRAGEL